MQIQQSESYFQSLFSICSAVFLYAKTARLHQHRGAVHSKSTAWALLATLYMPLHVRHICVWAPVA